VIFLTFHQGLSATKTLSRLASVAKIAAANVKQIERRSDRYAARFASGIAPHVRSLFIDRADAVLLEQQPSFDCRATGSRNAPIAASAERCAP
jgi:hypothetical protein